jgi:phenylacetate-CoA ligase
MLPVQQSCLESLRRTQWASPEKLLDYQRQRLEEIVRHAREFVPFYEQRLAPLFRNGACDLRAWREIPILTRAEVQAANDEIRARAVPRHLARMVEARTSGTTGTPLFFAQSEIANLVNLCHIERTMEAHGMDRTAHQARIRLEAAGDAEYPEGDEDDEWNLVCPTARQSRLGIQSTIAQQAEWLARRAPAYLTTYPSTAGALARQFEASGSTLPLKGVVTFGETVDTLTRDDVQRVFGCNIIDNYGTQEIGYIAFECPAGGGYHVCAENVLVELLDDDGNDAAEGERGRLVLTPFFNFAMPFIRYDIGDFAVAAQGPCSCGRTLPRLATILGRQRSIFTFPDGSQYSPWKWRKLFNAHLPAKQIQLVQTAPDCIELRYVPQDGAVPPDPALIEQIGRGGIHPMVLCRAVPVTEIPRMQSGKLEDCLSLVTLPQRGA